MEEFDEGQTYGYTIYESTDDHPTLLGLDGEPLRVVNRRQKLGFDLKPRKNNERKRTTD